MRGKKKETYSAYVEHNTQVLLREPTQDGRVAELLRELAEHFVALGRGLLLWVVVVSFAHNKTRETCWQGNTKPSMASHIIVQDRDC